ncbi:MAG: hypothetical protein ACKVTZ_12415 [Bacteroidia bacterium]
MNNKFLLVILAFFALSALVGCKKDNPEDWVPPTDENPAIALISPAQNNFVKYRGDEVTATFRLDDNEQLKNFRVIGQTYDDKDNPIGTEYIVVDEQVSGKHITKSFTYTIPNPVSLPDYFKVRLTAYAFDTKGAYAAAAIWVSVVPDPILPGVYTVQSYTGGKLYSAQSAYAANNKHRLTFLYGLFPPTGGSNSVDLQEYSSVAGTFSRVLKSPSNMAANQSNYFVVTNATAFNYNLATYETLQQAFASASIYYNTTPALNAGDILIMTLPPSYNVNGDVMYGAVRVNTVNDDATGDLDDYLDIDFKYTRQ